MKNNNSKSESYIVREAENIIERYLSNREFCNVKRYYQLKEKYEKLKILTISIFITIFIGTLLSVIIK